MTRNSIEAKRDWKVDNNTEGAFWDEIDRFFDREDILAALRAANDGKVGRRFRVPDCAIRWAATFMVAAGVGYRTAARALSRRLSALGYEGISYSQLHKRIGTLSPHDGTTDVNDARVMAFGAGAPPRPGPITVAVDSTGLSPDRPSGWMVEYWNHKRVRGWYKLHAAVDVDTGEMLAYVVTEPYCNDSPVFPKLMGIVLAAGHRVARVLADAAYDRKEWWTWMRGNGIEFVANIAGSLDDKKRGASSGRFKGCSVRGLHVRRILKVGREQWKKEVGYGKRWRIEATFGDLKRRFGDTVRARAPDRVADMIGFIVRVFNIFKGAKASL